MKKSKQILKVISLIVILVIVLGSGFTLLFGEQIENVILNNINSKIKKEVSLSEINFSLFKNFPYASVTFTDLLISSAEESDTDSLLFAKTGVVKLNLLDVLTSNYSISNISILHGNIHLKYSKNGIPNFHILKDSNSTEKSLQISSLEIENTNLVYENLKNKYFLKTKVNSSILNFKNWDNNIIHLKSDLEDANLYIDNLEYLNNKSVLLNSKISIKEDSILLHSSNAKINESFFEEVNYYYLDNTWELNCKVNSAELIEIIHSSPKRFHYLFKNHLLSGGISATIHVKKDKYFTNPYCNIDFTLEESGYKSKTVDFELTNIRSEGNFNNGKNRNFSTSKFEFNNFSSTKNDGELQGDFTLSNLNNYHLNTNLYSSWQLLELNHFLEDSPFRNLNGNVSGIIYYNGNISFDDKIFEFISSSIHSANLNFKDVYFNYKESDLEFETKEMNWIVENNVVKFPDENLNVSNTDLNFKGEISDLILYLINQRSKIHITGDVLSKNMKFEELYTITEINGTNEGEEFSTVLPEWIETDLEVNVESFWYKQFNAKKLKGNLKYDMDKLKLSSEKLEMKTLDGRISASFDYFENKLHDLVLKSNISLNKINISDGFKSFNNLGQNFVTDKNIKGLATANMYIQSMWDKDYKFYTPSLNVNAQLKIENGELIEFEPMYNLSDYVSLNELKNVKFANLENTIRIENEKIIIPEMDIRSTALSVHVSGSHSFNNIMDYRIRLLLSDVLGRKVKERQSVNVDEIRKNMEGKTTIQVKMRGHVDDYKISLDKVKLKGDVFEEIKKETIEIKNIIKEKILNQPDLEEKELPEWVEEDSGLEIEWEDEK